MIRQRSMVILIALGACIEFFAATLLVAGVAVACLMAAAHAMPTETDQGSVELQGTATVLFASEEDLTAALLGEEQE